MPFKMSNMHYNWWETGQLFEAIVNPPLEVLDFGYGQIYKTSFGNTLNNMQYVVTIRNFIACIYLNLFTMISSSLGW
jgi:hypothetical protein